MNAHAKTTAMTLSIRLVSAMGLGGCGVLLRRAPASTVAVVSEQRTVSGFDRVSMSAPEHLTVRQGSSYSLTLRGPKDLLDSVRTTVRGNTLYVESSGGLTIGSLDSGVEVDLTVPKLVGIGVSGAGEATVSDVTSTDLEATANGGADLKLEHIVADSLRLRASGAGDVSASGRATRQDIRLSGAAQFDGRDLAGAQVRVDVSGGGEASVAASETLDASASGGADVHYYGSPQVTQHASGGASVDQAH